MKKSIVFLLAAILPVIAACQKETEDSLLPKVTLTAGWGHATRMNLDNGLQPNWDDDDASGIKQVELSANGSENIAADIVQIKVSDVSIQKYSSSSSKVTVCHASGTFPT